ncbi:MAG: hypothetical protein AAGF67_03045 [Verrucomicrobiota bacterium]
MKNPMPLFRSSLLRGSLALTLSIPFAGPLAANESFDFLERFALSDDRTSILKELIPGTEEFYYYSALHAQQEGRLDEVPQLLEPWIKRNGVSPRVKEIQHRQALLTYGENAEASLQYLIRELGLRFDHEQETLDQKPDFAVSLNPDLVTWEAFLARSIQQNSLAKVKTSGFDRLIRDNVPLNPTQRRELLSRLVFPDFERLVGLIAADLRTPESRGFGEFPIHLQLTLSQLDELVGLLPDLANNPKLVDAKLLRLRPGADTLPEHSPEERAAYLERLWAYVSQLDPSFNSLKACILYQKLVEARSAGEFPMEEFLTYLRLPRPAPYVLPELLRNNRQSGMVVDLNADFSSTVGFPAISSDEALVRHFLEAAFLEDESYERFRPFIREDYLKQVFAETKLIYGIGDAAEHYSLLSPAQVQNIRERVEIAFSPENERLFEAGDEVSLSVDLKNVSDLLVKVYEINVQNYYLDQLREIGTDLKLDGLVANEEQRYEFEQPSVIRHEETFTFDSMKDRRGVWVVELIGNGISSRALVRKGKLQYLSNTTPGGELIQVVSENNEAVKNASAWFGGREYVADEDGSILLPFSQEGRVPVILSDGEISSLVRIDLPRESYTLEAGFFLEQESLLTGREATVSIRPQLHLEGEPVSVSLIENATLRIRTTDVDGVSSTLEINQFELLDDRESVQSFRVPNRLQSIHVSLEGELPLVSESGEAPVLTSEREFFVNGTDTESQVFDLFLSRFETGYRLELLGKMGEPIAERPVNLVLSHADFTQPFSVVLKSDAAGGIDLGQLEGITFLEASANGSEGRNWGLLDGNYSYPGSIHAVAGEEVVLPLTEPLDALSRSDIALFELRSGVPVTDHFDEISLEDSAVRIAGLKGGDYRIVLRRLGRVVDLHVTESDSEVAGYALSGSRHLQLSDPTPLHIRGLEEQGDQIVLKVANADEMTRVHVIATRFLPQFDLYHSLRRSEEMPLFRITRGSNPSLYLSGRDIGEEYRYILERRDLQPYPGNMLERPGLLLNPWELNETSTDVDDAEAGEDLRRQEGMKEASRAKPGSMQIRATARDTDFAKSPTLQFFKDSSLVLSNLEVDENGVVEIDTELLQGRQYIQVVALNATATASRQLALPEPEQADLFRDLRLSEALDGEKTFTKQRKTTLLGAGESLTIEDLRSTEMEVYGTIGDVYSVLLSIQPDPDLMTFGFVTGWDEYEEAEKRRLYSKHACHELHFFLAKKDPDFFQSVVQPYLANKKDKTFLDDYLLGENLESYLRPWAFGRLNVVERILLGQRLGGEQRASTAKHVSNLFEMNPVDVGQKAFFFSQALKGRRLGGGESSKLNVATASAGFAFEAVDAFADSAMESAPAPPSVAAARPMLMSRGAAKYELRLDAVADLRERADQQRLYRQIESTKEWAENNYYQIPIQQQTPDLISVNGFWEDFAAWEGAGDFYSRDFAAATQNFTEMMFALGVLDLPFEAEEHEIEIDDVELTFTAKSPVIIFHEEIEESERAEGETPVLVSQNYYRASDRFRIVDGEREDKFVTDEFLAGEVYGSQIVVTNPTSSFHRLDLLAQIPEGSIPVAGSDYTKSYPLNLSPFSTEKFEVSFYFPRTSGKDPFEGYPVQVAKEEKVIAKGQEASFEVVDRLSEVDRTSWDYLSQEGTEEEVLEFLGTENLQRISLSRIAWRAKEDLEFFRRATDVISARHAYDDTIWSYGLFHGVTNVARQYLEHQVAFLKSSGMYIDCELVSVNPVERHWYEHLEYSPLVNARTHRLGKERAILNDRFLTQYQSQLRLLSYKPELSAEDRLSIAAYLFLQDRIDEGLAWQESVEPEDLGSRLQYDYLTAYAAFYREDLDAAAGVAEKYADYSVDRWKDRFAEVTRQLEEIAGGEENPEGDSDEALSSLDPFLELTATGRDAQIKFRNLEEAIINYYEMDLELLFSSQPFVSGGGGQFAYIQPNKSEEKQLPEDGGVFTFEIPEEFSSKNVLVEVVASGQRETVAVYSNRLDVQLSERYGRLDVDHDESGEAVPRAYVKVYAKMKDGSVRFFKDGYTDLRGKFDYVGLSTNELDTVEKFSLLVMSDEEGSIVKEVDPPQR